MDCQTCKKLLSKFLDNELDKKQQLLMTKHIEDCPACAQSLESITEMVNIMHKIKAINPPAELISKVNKSLDQLPFWDKVLLGIRNFIFSNRPVKSFALLATLILVFAVTEQLNIHLNKTGDTNDSIVLRQNAAVPEKRVAAIGRSEQVIPTPENIMKKKTLSEPASEGMRFAEIEAIHETDETNAYIKANDQQVLILSSDKEITLDQIEKIISNLDAKGIEAVKQENFEILTFEISYINFLRLHSDLSGIGQLEKETADVQLYENKDSSTAWQNKAFSQPISVKLRILR